MSILTPIDASCATCRWWCADATDGSPDSCHRHAPPWPPTTETDWCGDWASDYAPLLRHRDD